MNSVVTPKITPPPDAFFQGAPAWHSFQNDHPEQILVTNFEFGEGAFATKDHYFYRAMRFENCVFSGDATITGGRIDSHVEFIDCQFLRSIVVGTVGGGELSGLIFSNCQVTGHVSIQTQALAKLILDCDILGALTVQGNSSNPYVDFVGGCGTARSIKGVAAFYGRFGTVDFAKFKFKGGINIDSGAWIYDARFSECEIVEPFRAAGSQFEKKLDLSRCTAQKGAEMRGTRFNGPIDISGATIKSDIDLSAASELEMREIFLDGTTLHGCLDLSNRSMTRRTSMYRAKFLTVPRLHGASLFSDTIFLDAEFPAAFETGDRLRASDAENSYRALRFASKAIEAHSDEQRFFSLEMRARRAAERNGYVRSLYWLYEKLSNYGQSVYRPLFGFVAVLVASFIGFAMIQASVVQLQANQCGCAVTFSGRAAVDISAFAAAQALPFVPVFKDATKSGFASLTKDSTVAQIAVFLWSTVTAISSLLMMFLGGLGLRNQFRLK